MQISRRNFLKIMGGASALFAFPQVFLNGCKKAVENALQQVDCIWLKGNSCGGCSRSLLNKVSPRITEILTNNVNIMHHPAFMCNSTENSLDVIASDNNKNKESILLIEGSIDTTFLKSMDSVDSDKKSKSTDKSSNFIKGFLEKSKYKSVKTVIAVGSCAAYGGIRGNPADNKTVSELVSAAVPVINVPGCPPHPDWIVGTMMHALLKGIPELDEHHRPYLYYKKPVHKHCERLIDYKRGKFAANFGDSGCLYKLGCLGMDSGCDISQRAWGKELYSCTSCGNGCIGCTEVEFPHFGKRGIVAKPHIKSI